MQPCSDGQEGLGVVDRRASCGGDAGGSDIPATKEVTAGCGSTHSADSDGAAVEGGSQRAEQHEEGGNTQADRRERKAQGQSSALLDQSSG